jgi:hypothetical protein
MTHFLSWSISPYLDAPELYALHCRFEVKSSFCFEGRNRNVFELAHCVVKLPKNPDGYTDNDWEGSVSNSSQTYNSIRHIQYPRKRLIYFKDIPVLFMEKIIPVDWSLEKQSDYPRWTDQVDCAQVGYTKEGRLVAYDYGPR